MRDQQSLLCRLMEDCKDPMLLSLLLLLEITRILQKESRSSLPPLALLDLHTKDLKPLASTPGQTTSVSWGWPTSSLTFLPGLPGQPLSSHPVLVSNTSA